MFGFDLSDIFISAGNQTAQEQRDNTARLTSLYNAKKTEQASIRDLPTFVTDYQTPILDDQGDAALVGFSEGLQDGWDNVLGAPQKAANFAFGSLFKAIPWQLYIVAAIVAFVYLGGLKLFKGKLAK